MFAASYFMQEISRDGAGSERLARLPAFDDNMV